MQKGPNNTTGAIQGISFLPDGRDITLCSGEGCPIKRSCFRYLAEPAGRQDFFGMPPVLPDGTCPEYWDAIPTFTLALDRPAVERLATEISRQDPAPANCAWELAEIYLRMKAPRYREGVAIQPPEQEIREQAYFLWLANQDDKQKWHWLLAEARLLSDVLNRLTTKRNDQGTR
jgi:hypothetical protein